MDTLKKIKKGAMAGALAAAALGLGGCQDAKPWRVDLSRDVVEDRSLAVTQSYIFVTNFREKTLCAAPYGAPMSCQRFSTLNEQQKAYVETARQMLETEKKNTLVKSAADVRVSPAL